MTGRRIAVTGASSGIGLALTERLLEAGDGVLAIDRNHCPAPGAESVIVDLANEHAIDSALDSWFDAPIHGLANVAGVPGTASAESVLTINMVGCRRLTERVVSVMPRGAAVVSVASVAAHRAALPPEAIAELGALDTHEDVRAWLAEHPLTGAESYDCSKAAQIHWSRELAAYLLEVGIRCVTVSPGPTETPILDDFRESMGPTHMGKATELVGRHGTVDEIAAVIQFLLSPTASWVNGIDIPVEGGLYAARATASNNKNSEGASTT